VPSLAPLNADRCTVPTAHMRAAPSRTMPPVRQQNLKKLVRKLGASSQPGEQAQALAVITEACAHRDLHFEAAIVAVGAIPVLVRLLGPGSPAEVQQDAAFILWCLTQTRENVATIAAAGAIPLLVQLLKPGTTADVQEKAAQTLANIASDDCVVTIASAGAIPHLVQLMAPSSPVKVQVSAVFAIGYTRSACWQCGQHRCSWRHPSPGAVSLDPGDGPPARMQGMAAGTLHNLAVNVKRSLHSVCWCYTSSGAAA
jgi:hypothetical protein